MSPKEDWKDSQGHCKAKATFIYSGTFIYWQLFHGPAPYKPHYTYYEPGNMEGSVGKTKNKIHSFSTWSLPWVTEMTDQTITTPEACNIPC